MNKIGLIKITIIFGMLFTLFISMGVYAYCDISNSNEEVEPATECETTTECEIETETFTEVVEPDKADEVETEIEVETETEPQYVSLGIYTITAYCSCNLCCGKFADNRPLDENGEPIVYGASGEELIANYSIAVDAELFNMGEVLWFNDRQYVCHDVGSAIKGKKIDLYMSSHQLALEWGVQNIEVFREVRNIFE